MNPHFRLWLLLASSIALPVITPLLVIAWGAWHPDPAIWAHLREFVLPEIWLNTAYLAAGVGTLTLLLGVSLAALTSLFEFPGRKILNWALMLPLALPAYVLGFVHIGIWDFTGPIQTTLRQLGISWSLPSIRSFGGGVLVLSLALFPYVYLLARSAFKQQAQRFIEAGQSLGLSPTATFFRVVLPMARPALAGGVLLVLMETLADFGTVSLFNIETFTTVIYKAWFSLFSLPTAQLLAACLGLIMLTLVLLEPWLRGRRSYASQRSSSTQQRQQLPRGQAYLASIYGFGVLILALLLPLGQLGWWVWKNAAASWDDRFPGFIGHTLMLGALTAGIVAILAVVLALSQRRLPSSIGLLLTRIATIGYAIPGTVLAVGIFVPLAALDNFIIAQGWASNSSIRTSLYALVAALVARFLAVGFQPINSSLARISPSMENAAALLGSTGFNRIRRITLPLLRNGLWAAIMLTAVDVMKEMPITLMMRPFGWDTLALRVFELTSEGQWEYAALPALSLGLIGLLPVIWMSRQMDAPPEQGTPNDRT